MLEAAGFFRRRRNGSRGLYPVAQRTLYFWLFAKNKGTDWSVPLFPRGKKRAWSANWLQALPGSPSWTRTNDPAVNSRMLYRLSY